ncbi:MAG: PspC domain-containing protein [Leifsonia sp.]
MSQHDSTPPPPPPPPPSAGSGTPSSPYGGPRTGLSGRGTRFFDWMRGLRLVRTDGWIGGVCAAIANRLGIDPLIVRGIVVVAAILGAPALLLYAAAWALLPDAEGRIHLQRLIEGGFEPAVVGIGALALLSLLPAASGLWWVGGGFWAGPSWGAIVGRVIWTSIVVGAVVTLVIVATNRSRGGAGWGSSSATPGSTGPKPSTAASTTIPAEPATEEVSTPVVPSLDTSAEPTEPPSPTAEASSQDVADWQARHAAWQAEHAQWKQRLNEDMRAVKAQRAAELRAQSAAVSAQAAAERNARRAANPRVGAVFGWAIVGMALVGAALTVAWWPTTTLPGYSLTAAFAVATLVFGLGVLIAGLVKRRSGFLIFLGILLAVVTLVSAFIPRDNQLLFDGASVRVQTSDQNPEGRL